MQTTMKLTNIHGVAFVQPLGAMLHDCIFQLDGREVRPLYDAPWRGDGGSGFAAQPPIIQGLGSEWPCVPFGRPAQRLCLPSEWERSAASPWDDWAHGYSSNGEWRLERLSHSALRAMLDYPENTPILRLQREVHLLEDRPGVSLSLTIHARRETRFPLGLHPVLSMEGARPQTMWINVPNDARVWSFPVDVEPGCSYYRPNQQNCALDQLETCKGGTADIRTMPPDGQTEDLLMLTGTDGAVGLVNPVQGCVTTVEWNTKQLPGCLLWVSNGGRDYYPWNSRVAALGIEPIASAFDLGMAHSLSSNTPLADHGVATSVKVTPEEPLRCNYTISIKAMPS